MCDLIVILARILSDLGDTVKSEIHTHKMLYKGFKYFED